MRKILIAVVVLALGIGGWWVWQSRQQARQTEAASTGGAPGAQGPAGAAQGGGGPARPGARGPGQGGPGGPGGPRGPGGPGGDAMRPLPVLVGDARTADVDIILNALGTVVARSTVTVRSRVDGQLQRIAFDEGQVVRKGDLLAEVDPRPFQVELTQAEGQLARDRAQLQNARVDLKRYRGLLAKDSIASQQVDSQVALVSQLEGTVAADQGQVDSAKLQLSFTRITAPISGRVGLRQVDVGNMIRASDANGLVVITEVQPIAVLFSVPSDHIAEIVRSLGNGKPPVVQAWDRRGDKLLATGELRSLDNQIDASTGTIRLKAEFANEDFALFPNQFVNIRLHLRTLDDVTVIPPSGVQRSSAGPYAFVVDASSRARRRPITVGDATDEVVVVTSGIEPGERVVIDGADRIRDGQVVEAISRAAAG